MSTLLINNIHVRTSSSFGLRDISLALNPGELIGVIGPNGAGKSTFAKSIVGLAELHSGDILYDKQSVFSLKAKERATLLGYLPQNASFSWSLCVKDAIKLGRINTHLPAPDAPTLNEVVDEVGLSHLLFRQATQLSGGEQMRVHLARLFYGEHKIMILDEPCAALDIKYQHQILNLIRKRIKHAAGLVILHDFTLAQTYCDKLLVLSDGEARLFGSPEEILRSPITAEIFGVDFHAYAQKGDESNKVILPIPN